MQTCSMNSQTFEVNILCVRLFKNFTCYCSVILRNDVLIVYLTLNLVFVGLDRRTLQNYWTITCLCNKQNVIVFISVQFRASAGHVTRLDRQYHISILVPDFVLRAFNATNQRLVWSWASEVLRLQTSALPTWIIYYLSQETQRQSKDYVIRFYLVPDKPRTNRYKNSFVVYALNNYQ